MGLDPTTFSWQVTMDMPKILFRITCVLPSNAENANAATLSTYKGKSTYKADAVDKPFDVNIAYFPSGYGQPAATTADTYSVDTTTPVRLRYELNPAYWGALVLQAKSCWVSPFADSTKNPKMHIIENWCKKDDILTSSMSGVTKNNQDKSTSFSPASYGRSQNLRTSTSTATYSSVVRQTGKSARRPAPVGATANAGQLQMRLKSTREARARLLALDLSWSAKCGRRLEENPFPSLGWSSSRSSTSSSCSSSLSTGRKPPNHRVRSHRRTEEPPRASPVW